MRKTSWVTMLSVVLTLGVLAFLIFMDPDIENIGSIINHLSSGSIFAAFGCMAFFWLCESAVVCVGCKLIPGNVSFLNSIKVTFIGQYYSALTPFSSGGQPMQVAYMRRWGVPVGSSSSIFAVKYLCWHIVMSIVAVFGFLFNWQMLKSHPTLLFASIIGMFLNTFGIVLALLILSKANFKKPVLWLTKVLIKFRICKDEKIVSDSLINWVEDFNEAIQLGKKHPFDMFKMLILTFLQILGYFSVTYCLYKGLGFSGYSWFYIALLQSILNLAVSFVPLPGASGASEGAFYILFKTIFTSGTTLTAMILWRVFTYYSHLAIGSVISLYDGMKIMGISSKKESYKDIKDHM